MIILVELLLNRTQLSQILLRGVSVCFLISSNLLLLSFCSPCADFFFFLFFLFSLFSSSPSSLSPTSSHRYFQELFELITSSPQFQTFVYWNIGFAFAALAYLHFLPKVRTFIETFFFYFHLWTSTPLTKQLTIKLLFLLSLLFCNSWRCLSLFPSLFSFPHTTQVLAAVVSCLVNRALRNSSDANIFGDDDDDDDPFDDKKKKKKMSPTLTIGRMWMASLGGKVVVTNLTFTTLGSSIHLKRAVIIMRWWKGMLCVGRIRGGEPFGDPAHPLMYNADRLHKRVGPTNLDVAGRSGGGGGGGGGSSGGGGLGGGRGGADGVGASTTCCCWGARGRSGSGIGGNGVNGAATTPDGLRLVSPPKHRLEVYAIGLEIMMMNNVRCVHFSLHFVWIRLLPS